MDAREEAIEVMAQAMYERYTGARLPGMWVNGKYESGPSIMRPCPSCNGKRRINKGPIAYLSAELERVGVLLPDDERHEHFAGQPCIAVEGDAFNGDDSDVLVYCLPSESTNGVKVMDEEDETSPPKIA